MTTIESDRFTQKAVSRPATAGRKVWDWPTRCFHWSLVVAMVGAYASNKAGASWFWLHSFFGYAVIVLVAFRVVWGFIGTRHARFASFVEGPRGVLRYLSAVGRGRQTRYAGHNPLGAVMVLLLLALLGAQAAFGLFGDDEIFNAGPLAALVGKETSLLFTSLHRKLFHVILAAVALHVGAVILHVVVKREPLVRAMVTGAKPGSLVAADEAIGSSRGAIAVLLFLALAGALAAGLALAPASGVDIASY
jgi:cytochrome b